MATGGADLHKAVRETLLVCQVCREDFALDSRPPRLLPCFHCFCQPCLSRLGKTPPLRCPQCRGSFSAEDVWLLDTTRTQLLELTDLKEGGHERSCQGCSQSLPAQSWCQHCAQALCQQCCQAHRVMKVFKDHVLVPLGEVTEEHMRQFQALENCDKHPTERLKFFCEKCDAAACSDCAIIHHSGHRLTGLQAVVEERRKQVLSWCQKVGTALPAFQNREASSQARLRKLDSTLQDKVQHLETLFSDIVCMVMARQNQAMIDLKAKVKSQRLEVEGQYCQDQSMVESARTMVDHGKRVASLGLPTQLIGLPKKMEEAFERLQKPREKAVEPLFDVQILENDFPALMTFLEKVGEIAVFPFTRPEFKLAPVQNPAASLDMEGCALSNDFGPWGNSTIGNLNGTTTTEAAPDTNCYWQVRCLVKPHSDMQNAQHFCNIGICEPESLLNNADWRVSEGNQTASVVTMVRVAKRAMMKPYIEATPFQDIHLTDWPEDAPLDCTVGFLLDRPKRRLHVIDVNKAKVLLSIKVKMDKPLWPVLCVCPKEDIRADIWLKLQSGEKMSMPSDIIKLLKSQLTQ